MLRLSACNSVWQLQVPHFSTMHHTRCTDPCGPCPCIACVKATEVKICIDRTHVVHVSFQALKLALYRDGQLVVDFIAYLVARGVGKSTTERHIGTAKKVLDYMESFDPWDQYIDLFACLTRYVVER